MSYGSNQFPEDFPEDPDLDPDELDICVATKKLGANRSVFRPYDPDDRKFQPKANDPEDSGWQRFLMFESRRRRLLQEIEEASYSVTEIEQKDFIKMQKAKAGGATNRSEKAAAQNQELQMQIAHAQKEIEEVNAKRLEVRKQQMESEVVAMVTNELKQADMEQQRIQFQASLDDRLKKLAVLRKEAAKDRQKISEEKAKAREIMEREAAEEKAAALEISQAKSVEKLKVVEQNKIEQDKIRKAKAVQFEKKRRVMARQRKQVEIAQVHRAVQILEEYDSHDAIITANLEAKWTKVREQGEKTKEAFVRVRESAMRQAWEDEQRRQASFEKAVARQQGVAVNHAVIQDVRAKAYVVRNEALDKAREEKIKAIAQAQEEKELEVSREWKLREEKAGLFDRDIQYVEFSKKLRAERENRFKLKDQRIKLMERAQEYDHEVRMFKVQEQETKIAAKKKAQEALKDATIKEVQRSQRLQEDLRAKFTKLRTFANRPNLFMRKIQEMDIPLPEGLLKNGTGEKKKD